MDFSQFSFLSYYQELIETATIETFKYFWGEHTPIFAGIFVAVNIVIIVIRKGWTDAKKPIKEKLLKDSGIALLVMVFLFFVYQLSMAPVHLTNNDRSRFDQITIEQTQKITAQESELRSFDQPKFDGKIWRVFHIDYMEESTLSVLFVDLVNQGTKSPAKDFKVSVTTPNGKEVSCPTVMFTEDLTTDSNDRLSIADYLEEKVVNRNFDRFERGILTCMIDELNFESVIDPQNKWSVTLSDYMGRKHFFENQNIKQQLAQDAPTKAAGLKTVLGSIEDHK